MVRLETLFRALLDAPDRGISLLLLRDTVLGAASTTSPNIDLWLRRHLFAIIYGQNLGVDVTEEQKRGRWPRGRVLKIILRQPQVLTFLGESTKPSHKPWSSSIEAESFVTSFKDTPKPPSVWGRWRTMCAQILLELGASQPSACCLVPFFKNVSAILRSTCYCCRTQRLVVWCLCVCSRVQVLESLRLSVWEWAERS